MAASSRIYDVLRAEPVLLFYFQGKEKQCKLMPKPVYEQYQS